MHSGHSKFLRDWLCGALWFLQIVSEEPTNQNDRNYTQFRIELLIRLNFLTSLLNNTERSAAADLRTIKRDLQRSLDTIEWWQGRLSATEQLGFSSTQRRNGREVLFHFECLASYATEEEALAQGHALIQTLFNDNHDQLVR